MEKTGANISIVKFSLLLGLDRVRRDLSRRIILLRNGLTSGEHSAPEHRQGIAVDFTFLPKDGPIDQSCLYTLLKAAIDHGFRGVGFYFNGIMWSFHLDLRKDLTLWTGRKAEPGKGPWVLKQMSVGFPSY